MFTDFRSVTFRLDEGRLSVQVAFPTAKTEFLENGAVSMDRCNTGLEFTSGGFKAQSCSRALIQPSKPLAATFWLSHESTNRKQGLVRSLPARPASKFDPSARRPFIRSLAASTISIERSSCRARATKHLDR